jgi:hypothetical protein
MPISRGVRRSSSVSSNRFIANPCGIAYSTLTAKLADYLEDQL